MWKEHIKKKSCLITALIVIIKFFEVFNVPQRLCGAAILSVIKIAKSNYYNNAAITLALTGLTVISKTPNLDFEMSGNAFPCKLNFSYS